jgi:hypothetical protein
VHPRVLMVAALTTGAWVGACSRPTSQNDQSTSNAGTRQIELVNPPASGVLASDLETRRAPTPARSRTTDRPVTQAISSGQADATPTHDHAMMAAAVVVPEVGRTTSSVIDAPLTLAAAPLPAPHSTAPTMLVGDAFGAGSGPSAGNDSESWPGPVSRGPTILIRGGMGSPVDDCKIHGQGGRGPGLAINRITPSFGSEVRGNSGGRFPRGGIR